MDSVSQKQNFLSLTGIDQLSENTDNIELGAVVLRQQAERLTALEGQLDTINTNDIPNYVSTKATNQTIEGTKTFTNLVAATATATNLTVTTPITTVGLNSFYNSQSKLFTDIALQTNDAGFSKSKLVYNPRTGVTIVGNLFLEDGTKLKIADGTLDTLKNTSVTTNTITTNTFNVLTSATIISITAVTADIKSLTISTNPLLNVSIPFQPSALEGMTVYSATSPAFSITAPNPICFYASSNYVFKGVYSSPVATDITACSSALTKYVYPTNYFITHISAMFDGDTIAVGTTQTYTVVLSLWNGDGSNSVNLTLGTATFSVASATRCGLFKFPSPLLVPATNSLGGTHKFSLTTAVKECFYVIHGYQA